MIGLLTSPTLLYRIFSLALIHPLSFIKGVNSLAHQILDLMVFEGIIEGELSEGKRVEFVGHR